MKYNVHQAKTHFSKLIERALAGEEVIIARNGNPLLILQPINNSVKKRICGLSKGAGIISEDFDDELPVSVLDEFEK